MNYEVYDVVSLKYGGMTDEYMASCASRHEKAQFVKVTQS